MAYEGAFASLYFIFAVIFAIANVMTQEVGPRSDMYRVVHSIYTTTPYRSSPDKFWTEIATPYDLYEFFKFVLVPATFMEQPANGDSNGFCINAATCYIDEGDCDSDAQCTDSLTCRDNTAIQEGKLVNGRYWDADDLVTWCDYLGTPVDINLQDQECNPNVAATDSVTSSSGGPCCWDPDTNSYVTRIDPINLATAPTMLDDVKLRMNCPSSMDSYNDCCASPNPAPLAPNMTEMRSTAAAEVSFPVTVANFNRLIFSRFSMKRFKLEKNDHAHFGDMVSKKITGDGASLSSIEDNGDYEDKAPIPSVDGTVTMWSKEASFSGAGSYSKNFPRVANLQTWSTWLNNMKLDNWFDARMATATIEMLFFNGNVDTFMYIVMGVQFDFAGTAVKTMSPSFINLNNQKMEGSYSVPRIIEKVLIGLVIFFFCVEVRLMLTTNYFAKPTKIVDLLSLALCTTVLSLNYVIANNETFLRFSFDTLLDGTDDDMAELIRKVTDLLSLNSTQAMLVAINMLMIFIRAVMLVTTLEGQLGLIIETLGTAASRLGFFFFQYMLLLLGFVAFAYFTFGQFPEESGMTDLPMTFYIIFGMLVGLGKREDLTRADPTMTPIFLIIYYVVTVFVMQNMFVSILLSGYDQVWHDLQKRQLAAGKKDMNFLVRIFSDYAEAFQLFRRFFGTCIHLLWNGGLKYIWEGMTSCFWECLAMCDCGCPNPFKVCLNCIRACKGSQKELHVSEEMLMKEFEDTKKQVRKGDAWAKNVKDDPGEAQSLKEKIRAADDARRDTEEKIEESKRTGTPISDPDTLANLYVRLRASRFELKGLIAEQKKKESKVELAIMGVFLSTFIGMMILLVSMGDVYLLQESSLQPALDKAWDTPGTLRTTGFKGIQSFEDVGQWAFISIMDLYSRVECRKYPDPNSLYPGQPCPNAANDMQMVNTVNKWNIGFLNTTFVRVTIQPACFTNNPEGRWEKGYRFLRSKAQSGSCSGSPCFDKALEEEGTCLNAVGEEVNPQNTYVHNSVGTNFEIPYNYSEAGDLGPYDKTGGFTVSLGTTSTECSTMLYNLMEDRWFTKNSVSMVFDWVTYNGNFDYFAYNYVKFDLEPTGKLSSSFKTAGVPMNFERGGNWNANLRIVTLVLFAMYGLFVLYFLLKVLRDLNRERMTRKASGQGGLGFILAYYKSFWNTADTLSQILSIVSMVNFIDYLLLPFRNQYKFSVNALDKYAVPNHAVQSFNMLKDTDPSRGLQDDWYIFLSFETLAAKFETLLDIAALNSFFISIRVVKHVNQNSTFKVYSGTLSSGLIRQAYFFFVILLLLAGWALYFMIIFGNVDRELSGLGKAFQSLFMWILGNFDLSKCLDENKAVAIVSFVFYQILMNFVAINMFLATMLNTYAATVGQNEIDKENEKLRKEHETLYTMVEYKDKQAFKNDIHQIDVDGETREVYVKTRSKDGPADKNAIRDGGQVSGGHQIYKVNGRRDGWNHYDTIQEIYDIGIAEDERDHMVRIIFKESEPEKKGCSEFFGQLFAGDEKETTQQDIKPTVKGFWRKFGAVTQINNELTKQLQLSADMADIGDGDSDDGGVASDKGDGDDDKKSAAFEKILKGRVKKRLDTLLFSRAVKVPSQDDAIDPFDLADKESETYKDPEADKTEDELPIDDIREMIETESIQGWEVWLDCLISSIENEPEMEDECLVTEVLRTSEMQDLNKAAHRQSGQNVLMSFYGHASDVLSELEFKAKRKYFERLRVESSERYKMFQSQNEVLHDYACELEIEFTRIMENIHKYRNKKDVMRTKLAGLLDKEGYKHLDISGEQDNKSHMSRFTMPWQSQNPALPKGNETTEV